MVLSKTQSSLEADGNVEPVFGARYIKDPIPKFYLPQSELPKEAAAQIVQDQLQLDGKPRLNLASFVTTWMEPEIDNVMLKSFNKNAIDCAEYPAIAELQNQCVNMVARLFHAPLDDGQQAVGTATVGSSEGMLLAGLALKRLWQHRRKAQGLSTDHPNIICGANTHVVVEKFANYFETELRTIPVTRDCPCMDPHKAVKACDENTIGVVVILGSTYTGHFEDVELLNNLLEEKKKETGMDIPIHVDAASGGFVAPFLYPDLKWDFRLSHVVSINASGHKYGLTYPGVGWVVWRSSKCLPEDLVFHVSYLGEDQPTFSLNFSKSSQQIIGQYYQFVRLGFQGYTHVMMNISTVAAQLRKQLENFEIFEIFSPKDVGVPLVAFGLKTYPGEKSEGLISNYDIVDELRKYGWIVPVYTMPKDMEKVSLMRVSVREDFSQGLADWFIKDLKKSLETLKQRLRLPGKKVNEEDKKTEDGYIQEKDEIVGKLDGNKEEKEEANGDIAQLVKGKGHPVC